LNELEREIERLQGEIEDDRLRLTSEIRRLKELNAGTDEIEIKRLPLTEQLDEVENEFYGNIYKSVPAAYVLLLETLVIKASVSSVIAKENNYVHSAES
jgi:hypothetical protein